MDLDPFGYGRRGFGELAAADNNSELADQRGQWPTLPRVENWPCATFKLADGHGVQRGLTGS